MQAEAFVNPTLDSSFFGASITVTPVLTISLQSSTNSSERSLRISQALG